MLHQFKRRINKKYLGNLSWAKSWYFATASDLHLPWPDGTGFRSALIGKISETGVLKPTQSKNLASNA